MELVKVSDDLLNKLRESFSKNEEVTLTDPFEVELFTEKLPLCSVLDRSPRFHSRGVMLSSDNGFEGFFGVVVVSDDAPNVVKLWKTL